MTRSTHSTAPLRHMTSTGEDGNGGASVDWNRLILDEAGPGADGGGKSQPLDGNSCEDGDDTISLDAHIESMALGDDDDDDETMHLVASSVGGGGVNTGSYHHEKTDGDTLRPDEPMVDPRHREKRGGGRPKSRRSRRYRNAGGGITVTVGTKRKFETEPEEGGVDQAHSGGRRVSVVRVTNPFLQVGGGDDNEDGGNSAFCRKDEHDNRRNGSTHPFPRSSVDGSDYTSRRGERRRPVRQRSVFGDRVRDAAIEIVRMSLVYIEEMLAGDYATNPYLNYAVGGEHTRHENRQSRYYGPRDCTPPPSYKAALTDGDDRVEKTNGNRCVTRARRDESDGVRAPTTRRRTVTLTSTSTDIRSNERSFYTVPSELDV